MLWQRICTDREANISLLNNKMLVKFMKKTGHYEVAKIIEMKKVDGQKLLELKKSDVFEWNLTEYQMELVWNCIYQIKSNPLRHINEHHRKHRNNHTQEYLSQPHEEKERVNKSSDANNSDINILDYRENARKPLPVPHKKNEYFKFIKRNKINKSENIDVYKNRCAEDWDTISNTSSYYTASSTSSKEIERVNNVSSDANYDSYINNVDYRENARKPLPVPRNQNKYFKFIGQNKIEKYENFEIYNHCTIPTRSEDRETISNASSYYTGITSNDASCTISDYSTGCEYIYAPDLQGEKDNVTVERIKKYVTVGTTLPTNRTQQNFKICNSYIEFSNMTKETNNIYEDPLDTQTQIISHQSGTRKSTFQFYVKLGCCSCFMGYPQDDT